MSADQQDSRCLEGAADLVFVDLILEAIERLWESAGHVRVMDRTLFMLAVSEIATNIAVHSGDSVAMRVNLNAGADELKAVIWDTAPPVDIDWGSVTQPDPEAESGRGLGLARSVLDELRHEADSQGNTWTLVRVLRNSPE
ncbi:ATP-binding protein [Corynebacterium sp. A21]|uniref:ATP-binding protein n=1 Tax=Corynebacterium sp. A21 TaxID=3457318 RepID=UPI003FD29A8B